MERVTTFSLPDKMQREKSGIAALSRRIRIMRAELQNQLDFRLCFLECGVECGIQKTQHRNDNTKTQCQDAMLGFFLMSKSRYGDSDYASRIRQQISSQIFRSSNAEVFFEKKTGVPVAVGWFTADNKFQVAALGNSTEFLIFDTRLIAIHQLENILAEIQAVLTKLKAAPATAKKDTV